MKEMPVFSAADDLKLRWRGKPPKVNPPQTVILCYQPSLMDYARRSFIVRRVKDFFGELCLVRIGGEKVGVAGNFGLGSPAAVIMVEELVAFGVKRFISLGLAGSIQPQAQAGEWLVVNRAARDEGVSRHYLPEGRWAEADGEITAFLQNNLVASGRVIRSGAAWTTDTPFREMPTEIEAWQNEGVCAVDMETAALFSVGQALGVQVAAALVLADQVLPTGWVPPSNPRTVQLSLRGMLDAVAGSLIREARAR
ncbi:MAG TPA: nucleoside phosphorylase [Anaerolineaceae bacterium]|nr:nucleoside phosphorylase [Anaerolineaceae bacterium]